LGVVRRTIHYYVKEGLLPPPTGRGPSARYTEDHLLKLRYIQLMKESTHLRLEGIREALEPLAGDELEGEVLRMQLWSRGGDSMTPQLDRLDMPLAEAGAEINEDPEEALPTETTMAFERGPSDAERRLLKEPGGAPDTDGEPESTPRLRVTREMLIRSIKRFAPEPPDEATARPDAEPSAVKTADTWTRVRITDDLEIHFRPGAGGRFHKKLRRLLAMARKSFGK
jgi:DNA-binding transcriptional MerR regulator